MRKTVDQILKVNFLSPSKFEETKEHREWILACTDDELDEYILKTTSNPYVHPMALVERQSRHFKHLRKPHWTLTPSFWIILLALIVGLVAWLFPRDPKNRDVPAAQPSNSIITISPYTAMPQTNAASIQLESTPAKQTSPPAILETPNTNSAEKYLLWLNHPRFS